MTDYNKSKMSGNNKKRSNKQGGRSFQNTQNPSSSNMRDLLQRCINKASKEDPKEEAYIQRLIATYDIKSANQAVVKLEKEYATLDNKRL